MVVLKQTDQTGFQLNEKAPLRRGAIAGIVGFVIIISFILFTLSSSDIEENWFHFWFQKNLISTDPNLRVAFIADQSLNGRAVLLLIKSEGADMVLHQGDFDYTNNPDEWYSMISNVLGDDFPYFATGGGHDIIKWSEYQFLLYDRLNKIPGAECIGVLGEKSSCTYKGLFFILASPGILLSDRDVFEKRAEESGFSLVELDGYSYDSFIENQLNNNDHIWRVCSWARNMESMQVGDKGDATGWEVYNKCKDGGAIIATGHSHSYARTKTLIDMEKQIVDTQWPEPNNLRVKEGATFVFVSALGGHPNLAEDIPIQTRCLPTTYPYGCNGEWASIYTASQDATYGALFCTFNVDGQPNKAHCYFKNIDGVVIDEFTITSFVRTDHT